MTEHRISENQSAVTGGERVGEAKDKSEREQLVERWKARGITPPSDFEHGWTPDRISDTLKNLDALEEAEARHAAAKPQEEKGGAEPQQGEQLFPGHEGGPMGEPLEDNQTSPNPNP